jgi:hypothetical protein
MPSLRELQLGFAAAIVEQDAAHIAQYVAPRGEGTGDGLNVYLNNMYANLREALQDVFPVVERLVGEAFFHHAANRYIREHPSTSGDIQRFGSTFAAFLAEFAPAASLPYLPDTARLEWAMHEVFHAADHAPLAIEHLASVLQADCGALRCTVNPACRLLASAFPVSRIWSVNQPLPDEPGEVDADSGGEFLLIRRHGFVVEAVPLERAAFAMLQSLSAGTTVGLACERAMLIDGNFPLAAQIQRHILDGTIVGFAAQ